MTVLPAAIPSPSVAEWSIGPLTIRAYALCIIVGIIVALWWSNRRYVSKGGPSDAIFEVALWAVPLGIIGGRLYHVISSPAAYFGEGGDPLKAFAIWEGGLGIWGAIALGALGAWIGARRAGVRFAPIADAIAPTLLVAQAIGRLGNWFNQELFGGPTDLPWGLEIAAPEIAELNLVTGSNYPPGTLFHPTFLYELLWNLAAAALIVLLERRFHLKHGRVFWLYVCAYTLGRLWIEFMRVDAANTVLGLRLNVWTSIIVGGAALVVFIVIGRLTSGVPDPIYHPGKAPSEATTTEAESETKTVTIARSNAAHNNKSGDQGQDRDGDAREETAVSQSDGNGPTHGEEPSEPPREKSYE